MTIKKIEYLKKCQIVCREIEQAKNCLNYLKQLGFYVEAEEENKFNIVFWGNNSKQFITCDVIKRNLPIEFYNK